MDLQLAVIFLIILENKAENLIETRGLIRRCTMIWQWLKSTSPKINPKEVQSGEDPVIVTRVVWSKEICSFEI